MRAGPGLPLHGHVPDEQPGGRQRHAARRPVRQRRARRPAGRLRAGAVRLHRPGRRPAPRPTAPTTRGSTTYEGILPGLRRRARHARRTTGRGVDGWRARLRRARRRPRRCSRPSPTGPAEHSVVGVPHRSRCSSGSAARSEPWFAHLSYLRPHPPYSAAGQWSHALRPGRRGEPDRAGRRPPPAPRRRARQRRCRRRPPTRPSCATCGAQYFGMISEVDAPARPGVGHARASSARGTTPSSSSRRTTASSSATTACSRRSATSRRATTSSASSATRRRPPTRTARSSSASPRTSTSCRRCATRSASTVPAAVRRLPAHPVPARRGAAVVAGRRRTGSSTGATRCIGDGAARVAVGPPARAPAPRRAPHRRARLRAVRQRLVAVLRPRRRPDVAHRGRRPGAWCSRRPRRCSPGAHATPSARGPASTSAVQRLGRWPEHLLAGEVS